MASPGTDSGERAVYAHHVRALLRRQQQDDRDAIGATLSRARFRVQGVTEQTGKGKKRRAKAPTNQRVVDFFTASPLTGRDRQTCGFRIPHFDVKPITRTFAPTRKDGHVRHGHKTAAMTAGDHFDYVTSGATIGVAAHIDYIRRETGLQNPVGDLAIDLLDAQDLRAETNRLAMFTNIPGDRGRQRSLFEAAERSESSPRTHYLMASTAQVDGFRIFERMGIAPDWLRAMSRRLRDGRDELKEKAAKTAKLFRDREIPVAEVTEEEAFDRLAWLDAHPAGEGLFQWKQGRTGRVQHRFVGELPDGLSVHDRYEILSRFCGELGDDGWMVIGAIHQPDRHNDRRNFHIHVDGYDRPCRWLDEHGCWDFEYVERRNGKNVRPFAQSKVRYGADIGTDGMGRPNVAALMRRRFISTVNEVVGGRPDIVRYLHGTYADYGIAMTPLEHMGNRATGLEHRGIVTEVGSRNARKIVADEAAACEARATAAEAALEKEVAFSRSAFAHDRDALAALDRCERLERRLIRRRLQAELADVVVAMARSRADAVIRTLTPEPGRPVKKRAGDDDLRAAALEHLAWVDRHSPSPAERDAERRALAQAEARVAAEWRVVQAATQQASQDQARRSAMTYHPPVRVKKLATPMPSRYDDRKCDRLRAWLVKHAADPALLVIEGDAVRLGQRVPVAIDTLMRQFAAERPVQRILLAERDRRSAANLAAASNHEAWTLELPLMMPADLGIEPIVAAIVTSEKTGDRQATPIKEVAEQSPPASVRHQPDPEEMEAAVVQPTIAEANREARRKAARRQQALLREQAWELLGRKNAAVTAVGDRYQVDMTGLSAEDQRVLMHPDYYAEFQARLAEWHAERQQRQSDLPSITPPRHGGPRKPILPIPHVVKMPLEPPIGLRAVPALRDTGRLGKAPVLRASERAAPASPVGVVRRRNRIEGAERQIPNASPPNQEKPQSPRGVSGQLGRLAKTLGPHTDDAKSKGKAEPTIPDIRGKGSHER
ncbi:MobA/MobL family protein [Sphingomonas sanguinis]|uniref:MobA/MobL family protein n=1 Tax=Sphingomonas sp. LC-1 TaxID=3110957 RepID=UPI0021BB1B38|nr:MobA/MobL family protein [Sphingomonas sp. LC-1]MCT8003190.1 MobA/MobL family protein [Sphingomonas sp. LC-1]